MAANYGTIYYVHSRRADLRANTLRLAKSIQSKIIPVIGAIAFGLGATGSVSALFEQSKAVAFQGTIDSENKRAANLARFYKDVEAARAEGQTPQLFITTQTMSSQELANLTVRRDNANDLAKKLIIPSALLVLGGGYLTFQDLRRRKALSIQRDALDETCVAGPHRYLENGHIVMPVHARKPIEPAHHTIEIPRVAIQSVLDRNG